MGQALKAKAAQIQVTEYDFFEILSENLCRAKPENA